jgi:hypothetical protein
LSFICADFNKTGCFKKILNSCSISPLNPGVFLTKNKNVINNIENNNTKTMLIFIL